MSKWSSGFFTAALERAVKTFFQTYLGFGLVGDVAFNIFEFTWTGPELGISLGATLISLLTSLLSNLSGNNGPSLANETIRTVNTTNVPPHVA